MRTGLVFATLFFVISCKTSSPSLDEGTSLQTAAPRTPVLYEPRLVPTFAPAPPNQLAVCTWNIQWIGHWKAKRNDRLAETLKNCDVAVIQEMVTPPWDVSIAAKADQPAIVLKGDVESKAFVDAMKSVGFDGIELSPEDTGPNQNHINTTASEWYVLFYKTAKVQMARDLPHGFLGRKLAGHAIFSRVPFAFGVRALKDGKPAGDFVVVSVHLHAAQKGESSRRSKALRVREFRTISQWIAQRKKTSAERDYFVVGDMNIEDIEEVSAFLGEPAPGIDTELRSLPVAQLDEEMHTESLEVSPRIQSMNYSTTSRRMQGTNLRQTKPFDHVMHHSDITLNVLPTLDIFDMQTAFQLSSFASERDFVQQYSDHNPLRFMIQLEDDRD